MIAAMMLPSSLPAFGRFGALVSGRRDRRRLGAWFLAGCLGAWTCFGFAAFFGDFALHQVVDRWSWLGARPWLIGGGVLVLAGAFELSPLARRCRTEIGSASRLPGPGPPLSPVHAAQMGAEHGIARLERCWALMLLSFAAGMASLAWMAALTVLMVLQGKGAGGSRVGLVLGVGLLGLAGLVVTHPGWMPSLFPSAG